jgi:CheY-like chemotaxis protein
VWLKAAQPRPLEAPTPVPFTAGERRLKVLLIDDEPLVLRAMERILKAHEVTTAGSVGAALERISAGARFDVLVCDLMMPEQTGIDLYERLKASAPDLASRVVFMTGGAFTERAKRFLESVPNRQLVKPVDATVLRQTVFEVAASAEA